MRNYTKYLCLILFTLISSNLLHSQVAREDSLALIDLYNSTQGPKWTNHDNWLTGSPVRTWQGVVVENNRVVSLQFGTGNNLRDSLPSSIGNLTALKELNLNYNYISYIPEELGELVNLQKFSVRSNQIREFKTQWTNLSSLQELDISSNYVPQLPDSMGKLTNLRILDASYNELVSLPLTLKNLTVLNLTGNQYTEIPVQIAAMKSLKELYFSDNSVKAVPTEIFGLDSLTTLWLIGDLLTSIPNEISKLSRLQNLQLQGNFLSGLPSSIGSLINLNYLDISYNNIADLPIEIGKLKNLKTLWLVYNQLSMLPNEIGNLTSLKELKLQHNLISSLPLSFGQLKNLTDLYLDDNAISDTMPVQLEKLTNLMLISFRSNYLRYAPEEIFRNAPKLKWVFLENNKLENLPDFSKNLSISDLLIYSNRLTFEDIEPLLKNKSINLYYSPQDSVGLKIDTVYKPAVLLTLRVKVGGNQNVYKWLKNGHEIPGADSQYFNLNTIDSADFGAYVCRITNKTAADLVLYSREYRVGSANIPTGLKHRTALPAEYSLAQNYPNPFNPSTSIKYDLPLTAHVTLKIYSAEGREVRTLVDETQDAGSRSILWDGKNARGESVSSGIYMFKLQADSFISTKKMLLLK